jgi:predicted O-linked N-acetylglucosamine transferase (SPINDLY family)
LADKAIAANPGNARLLEAKAAVIRRSGQLRRVEAFLTDLLPQYEDGAWLHYQLGSVVSEYDRTRGNVHLRKAVALDATHLDAKFALIESLERTRSGDEGANIEEAYELIQAAMAQGVEAFTASHLKVAYEVLSRVCAFAGIEQLGTMKSLGRTWAEANKHTAFLKLLGQVRTDEDRFELLEDHRIWGRIQEARAAHRPVKRPPPRPDDGRIRLGFMSSDLRRHPVGYFALPLFEHIDRERFDVFCYSFFQGPLDPIQEFITQRVTAYRWNPDIGAPEAAQMIADDQLDLLIELGGSTHMNKLDVMAYRPALLQASWLGYPHSAGLSTIDHLMVDPFLMPERPDLLIEKPMTMPKSWIALGRLAFPEGHVIDPRPPHSREGVITFGTANNTYKYGPEMLAAWARIVAAVPGSRFLFVRPEGSSNSFRRNVRAHFEAQGVAAERVVFEAVRGAHMPHYNRIDIALDTFPQTGGTTTCEAAWMGVPTVSLIGPTLYERLSYSILANSGLGDLCTTTVDDYVAKAVQLAADRARIADLRVNLREQLKASPLGQTEQFATDFYDLVARTVEAAKVKA